MAGRPLIEHHVRALCAQLAPPSNDASSTDKNDIGNFRLAEILLVGYYDAQLFEPALVQWSLDFPAVRFRYVEIYIIVFYYCII